MLTFDWYGGKKPEFLPAFRSSDRGAEGPEKIDWLKIAISFCTIFTKRTTASLTAHCSDLPAAHPTPTLPHLLPCLARRCLPPMVLSTPDSSRAIESDGQRIHKPIP